MEESASDRRTFERISIESAEVVYLEGTNLRILRTYSDPLPLKDISQSGVRFEVDQYLGPGSIMDIMITVPGKQKVEIRGHVIWVTKSASVQKYEIGLQFLPYGNNKIYNSFQSKEQLDELINSQIN